jgi:hypothetical protein
MAIISNGTTIADAGAFSVNLGSMTHIKTLTASSSSSLSFVHGSSSVVLNSTYPIYKFEFINIHPSTAEVELRFNMSTDSGSNYNVTKTTTFFRTNNREDGAGDDLAYRSGEDLAQSTGYQILSAVNGAGNDEALSGFLYLFSPSSTTFVKHFLGSSNAYQINQDITNNSFFAGYGNTTNAVNGVNFEMTSGNIDSGKIKLYGIKDS